MPRAGAACEIGGNAAELGISNRGAAESGWFGRRGVEIVAGGMALRAKVVAISVLLAGKTAVEYRVELSLVTPAAENVEEVLSCAKGRTHIDLSCGPVVGASRSI